MDGESCILALPYSNTTFRATSVKLYLTLTTQIEGIEVKLATKPEQLTNRLVDKELASELTTLLVKRSRGRPRKNPSIIVFLQNDEDIT
jgi:hypothetical protein